MANSIGSVGTPHIPIPSSEKPAGAAKADSANFQNLLLDSIAQTNNMQLSAQSAIETGLTGGDITQVEVVTAVKKADMAMRLMLQIRNKLMDAYQEIQQLRM